MVLCGVIIGVAIMSWSMVLRGLVLHGRSNGVACISGVIVHYLHGVYSNHWYRLHGVIQYVSWHGVMVLHSNQKNL